MTDPISDLLIRIKNAYYAHHSKVSLPYSRVKSAIAEVLMRYGYMGKIDVKENKNRKILVIDLLYQGKIGKITNVEIVSKPGRRVYIPYTKIPKVLGGLGISVLSTSHGVMSGQDARKKKIGGELICKVW
ncbi:30S ribosomal protein S8 [Candidatus Gottesmanbacteria bacterium RBG_16_38_7b]|uniref:Small ribosomal subunit protein uS8 n=1 Tax=Candidatus Gottesmanbacteria bacterium RBG_16_38_7b TaxID=1798372 RepID=A0A1F5YFA2_9BACT|nr:MAG: 30S ribosomal protein S8 [Candidatus Gottesmanbacteria bacterium RBG_16_38_7b]